MSHAPDNPNESRDFDPRSERFFESLRNLLAFEIELFDTSEHFYRYERLFSINIVEAADFADAHLAVEPWITTQVRRLIDDELPVHVPIPQDAEGFTATMNKLFGYE